MNAGSAAGKPRLAALYPRQSAPPRAVNTSSQVGCASPHPGRNAGNADTQYQTGSTSPQAFNVSSSQAGNRSSQVGSTSPQPGRNAGNAGTQFKADSTSPRHLGLVLPRQAPCRSPRHSPPKRGENTLEDPKLKWVVNLSSKLLTQAQRSLLAKGPNFVVTPRHPPNLEYITAIESMCS